MKTTELFVDQVLIGLLVVVTLLALSPLPFPGVDDFDLARATGVVVLAYFAGILYDRFADTLLQDLERHHWLQVALKRRKKNELPRTDQARRELLDIGRYRMAVIRNSEASDYSDYLRSRMRLTRSLATLLPAMSLALVAHVIKEKCHRIIDCSAWNTPALSQDAMLRDPAQWQWLGLVIAVYGLVFLAGGAKYNLAKSKAKSRLRCLMGCRPPKTSVKRAALNRYRSLLGYGAKKKLLFWRQVWAHFAIDPLLCLGALGLFAAAAWMAVKYGQSHLAAVPVAALALTLLANWTWWRVHRTFLHFIENFENSQPPTP